MHDRTLGRSPPSLTRVALTALGTGVAGWMLENALWGPRYSHHFPNLPFMPVYAAGGAMIALLEPRVSHWSLPAQAITYGSTLTAVEGLAGLLERAQGRKSWDYGGSPVDLPHALAWTVLGTAVGQVLNQIE
jgi:hypothetical protein